MAENGPKMVENELKIAKMADNEQKMTAMAENDRKRTENGPEMGRKY